MNHQLCANECNPWPGCSVPPSSSLFFASTSCPVFKNPGHRRTIDRPNHGRKNEPLPWKINRMGVRRLHQSGMWRICVHMGKRYRWTRLAGVQVSVAGSLARIFIIITNLLPSRFRSWPVYIYATHHTVGN